MKEIWFTHEEMNAEIRRMKSRPTSIVPGLNELCVVFGEIHFTEDEKYKMKEIWYTCTLKLLMLTNEKSADQHHLVPGLPSISEWQRARQQTAGGENTHSTQWTIHKYTIHKYTNTKIYKYTISHGKEQDKRQEERTQWQTWHTVPGYVPSSTKDVPACTKDLLKGLYQSGLDVGLADKRQEVWWMGGHMYLSLYLSSYLYLYLYLGVLNKSGLNGRSADKRQEVWWMGGHKPNVVASSPLAQPCMAKSPRPSCEPG